MNKDLNKGKDYLDPMQSYLHNDLIHNAFTTARKKAWASIRHLPEIQRLYGEQKQIKTQQLQTREQTKTKNILTEQELDEIINPPSGK